MQDIFCANTMHCNLSNSNELTHSRERSVSNVRESVRFKDPQLWQMLPLTTRNSASLCQFKIKIPGFMVGLIHLVQYSFVSIMCLYGRFSNKSSGFANDECQGLIGRWFKLCNSSNLKKYAVKRAMSIFRPWMFIAWNYCSSQSNKDRLCKT